MCTLSHIDENNFEKKKTVNQINVKSLDFCFIYHTDDSRIFRSAYSNAYSFYSKLTRTGSPDNIARVLHCCIRSKQHFILVPQKMSMGYHGTRTYTISRKMSFKLGRGQRGVGVGCREIFENFPGIRTYTRSRFTEIY